MELTLEEMKANNYWLKVVHRNKLGLTQHTQTTAILYTGAFERRTLEDKYTIKCGITSNIKARQAAFNTPSNPYNPFQFTMYTVHDGMASAIEKYIHSLMDPLNIKRIGDNGKQVGSKEHFMAHQEWFEHMVKKIVNFSNECTTEVNEYIKQLDEADFNYDRVQKLPENKDD
jgi:hypothetical protein